MRLFTLVLMLMVSAMVGHVGANPSQKADRPNIVFILADDVSPEMFSCYNPDSPAKTPHIDSLATEGTAFRTCFSAASCGPSRALLMTGVYGNRTGVFANDIWAFHSKSNLFTNQTSWARQLRDSGYATAIAGKWHCGRDLPWSDAVGFEQYSLWETDDRIESLLGAPGDGGSSGNCRYWNSPTIENGRRLPSNEETYGPDVRCDFLLRFMEEQSEAGRPFLAYWPTVLPHGPVMRTPKTPVPAKTLLSSLWPFGNDDEKTKDRSSDEEFIGMVEYLDELVGRVIDRSKELGIYESTYFIFASDNGTANLAKNRGVEEGVRVPYIIAGPGIVKRGFTEELTDFSDIAPTLLEIAGIDPATGPKRDGKSQVPFLVGESATHRDWIYGYAGPVQVFRTKDYLLEARSPLYGTPDGRMFHTGGSKKKSEYTEIASNDPDHEEARFGFDRLIADLGPHLDATHPFWKSKPGLDWLAQNPNLEELAEKQLNASSRTMPLSVRSNTPASLAAILQGGE
jgi:arylsulfatase A-like enzyme